VKEYPFYVLVHRLENDADTEFLISLDAKMGCGPICPACGKPFGCREWLPPHRAEIEAWGSQYGDIAFGAGNTVLVSPRFKQVFEEHSLSGLPEFHPVEVTRVAKRNARSLGRPPAYLAVHVAYGKTAIDPFASGVEWVDDDECALCLTGQNLRRRRRIVVDEKTWTGEDIFLLRGLHVEFVVSDRFRAVCEENAVTNAMFVPAIHRR
jgi:hypothetical protein